MRSATIHPNLAFPGIVMGKWEMGGTVAECLAHGDPFGVERVGDAANRRLRAFLVDVPSIKMLDRAGVHDNLWGVDDGPRVHQGAGERISARLDHSRER